MRSSVHNFRGLVALVAVAALTGSCATPGDLRPFESEGPVWPQAPERARIQFIGEFGGAVDLGIRESAWNKFVALWAGARSRSLARPMAVVASNDGRLIYVADPDAQCVHRFDLDMGKYSCLVREEGSMLPSPVGLAISDSGQLFVSDSRLAQILTVKPGQDEFEVLDLDSPLQQPTGVMWDRSSQHLFVADTAAQTVQVINSDGGQVAEIGRHGDLHGEFNFPTYLWPDGEGGVLVTDSLNFRVQSFDAQGDAVSSFGELGDTPGNMSRPKGVAMDSYGHIYVVDALFHAIQVFDRQGRLLLVLGEQGQGPGQFWLPNGIYIAPDDTIYVADSYNNRVQVFRYVGGET